MIHPRRQKGFFAFFLIGLLTIAVSAGALFGQTTVTLEGKVTEKEGSPLPGTAISVRNVDTGYEYTAVTRPDGRYVVSGIQPGPYEVTATIQGFSTGIRRGLNLTIGSRFNIDFTLVPEAIQKEVIVTAETPMVEVTKSEVGSVVDRRRIDDLPLYDRDFGSLTILKPGVADGRGNAQPRGGGDYLIDGVSDKTVAQGSVRSNIPADAIQEFRVITNQMQAEYGNATGLIQSAITRSGTNEVRGRLSTYYRNEAFDSVNYFVNHLTYKGPELDKNAYTKPKFEHLNYGGLLGGPIIKDKLHFFLAYEGQNHTDYATITSPLVPRETVNVPFDTNRVLAKLTYQPGEKHLFSFKFGFDGWKIENGGIGGYTTKERAINGSSPKSDFQLNWTYYPSDNSMNEARAFYSHAPQKFTTVLDKTYAISRPSGQFGPPVNYPQTQVEERYDLIDNFSLFLGNHTIKMGFDAAYVNTHTDVTYYRPGAFVFSTDAAFNPAVFATYPLQLIYNNSTQSSWDVPFTAIGVFIQDAWQLHQRFSLNLGLRYNYYSGSGLDIDNKNIRAINPRVGFSWDPVGDSKTQIRGGIGTFTNNPIVNAAQTASILNAMDLRVKLYPNYPDPTLPNPFFPQDYQVIPAKDNYLSIENQVAPYTVQTTLGFQREVWPDFSASLDLVWAGGFRIMRTEQYNPVKVGTGNVRVDPTKGNVYVTTDRARSDYKAAYVTLTKRYSHGWALDVAYTLSRAYSHLNSVENNGPDSYEPNVWERMWGPIDRDARHRLTVSGIFALPFGFQASALFSYRSAVPWNAVYQADLNKDSLPGDYVDQQRNSRRGFENYGLNVRISKFFVLGRVSIDPFVEVYNVTDKVNFAGINPYIDGTLFGQPTGAGSPRQFQLGMRIDF